MERLGFRAELELRMNLQPTGNPPPRAMIGRERRKSVNFIVKIECEIIYSQTAQLFNS